MATSRRWSHLRPDLRLRPVPDVLSEAEDLVLSARERGQNREEAMREYLAWEIALVTDMATDDDHRFRVIAG
jgi:hypothetical protein